MNVFVVEDHAPLRRGIIGRLKSIKRIEVVGEAESETEALTMIHRLQPDVVLLDLSLAGGGSGYQVLRELRLTGFAGKVVIVSSERAAATACLQAGADGFYDKASDLEILFDDLADFATRQPQSGPLVAWSMRPS